jgi:hypothetical protein
VRTTPISDLPDDALLFLVSSRYCDSDKLADFAWSHFGKLRKANFRKLHRPCEGPARAGAELGFPGNGRP